MKEGLSAGSGRTFRFLPLFGTKSRFHLGVRNGKNFFQGLIKSVVLVRFIALGLAAHWRIKPFLAVVYHVTAERRMCQSNAAWAFNQRMPNERNWAGVSAGAKGQMTLGQTSGHKGTDRSSNVGLGVREHRTGLREAAT